MKNSEIKWTDKQKETIENRENNILVSAAAGSGKTAVLVERIKQLIIFDEVPIDRLLVVTFTKAAASEMKEKLLAALNKAASSYPEKVSLLRRQLDRINEASISTFHSFALDVIRRYFHIIELDPGFKVCDEAESKIMKAQGMDLVFDDLFEEGDSNFLHYINCYGDSKNETQLKQNLIGLYEKLRSIPNSMEWLDAAIEQIGLPTDDFLETPVIKVLKSHLISKTMESRRLFSDAMTMLSECGLERQAEKCALEAKRVDEIAASLKNGDLEECGRLISQFKGETIRVAKNQEADFAEIKDHVKGLRDHAKGILRGLKEKFFSVEWMACLEDVRQTHENGIALSHILTEFDMKYSMIKRDKGLIDFSDIEHFAIKILENPVASREYQEKFRYIFIDEYQDSNILQERIIESIKRPNNVFMVGDIKQSIYKFRLAEPEIFQEKYDSFKCGQASESITIDLNRNFRSKPPIIDAVNGIFSRLMEYDDDAALRGEPQPTTLIHPPVEMVVVDGMDGESDVSVDTDEAVEDLKLIELEGLAAADIIKRSLNQPIYDSKRGETRPIKQKDIVILMHGVKGKAPIFYEILQNAGIDCYIDDHSGYFGTIEITQFLDLLKVIDNFKSDVPLIGVLRSPFFNYTVEDFVEIRNQCPGSSFHEALMLFNKVGDNERLAKKTKETLDRIFGWKRSSKYLPIHEFVWNLMVETGFYAYMGGMPGGSLRQANLRIFVERARNFKDTGDGSIYGFIRYINTLAERDIETEQAKIVGENDDVVRIMTIHKSKGLEFPVVIVATLGNKLIFDKIERSGVMHKDIGIGLTRTDPNGHWYRNTLIQQVVAAKKKQEELEEAVRVLYVAFTRAMDRLVLLAAVKNWGNEKPKLEAGLKNESSYLGMIFPHLSDGDVEMSLMSRGDLISQVKEKSRSTDRLKDCLMNGCDFGSEFDGGDEANVIGARLSYSYPYQSDLTTKSKYSVSEIITPKEDVDSISQPVFLSLYQRLSSTEFGDAIHVVMEHIDPSQYHDNGYLQTYLDNLVHRELLTSAERAAIDGESILSFGRSDIGKRLANAIKVHRETPFNFQYMFNGKQVMVQGIVDCWFEEDGKITIIDYKTGTEKSAMMDKYQDQLKLYRIGLEAILDKPVAEAYLYFFGDGHLKSAL